MIGFRWWWVSIGVQCRLYIRTRLLCLDFLLNRSSKEIFIHRLYTPPVWGLSREARRISTLENGRRVWMGQNRNAGSSWLRTWFWGSWNFRQLQEFWLVPQGSNQQNIELGENMQGKEKVGRKEKAKEIFDKIKKSDESSCCHFTHNERCSLKKLDIWDMRGSGEVFCGTRMIK